MSLATDSPIHFLFPYPNGCTQQSSNKTDTALTFKYVFFLQRIKRGIQCTNSQNETVQMLF